MEAEKERERKHKCTNKNIVIVHNYIILFYCDFELGRYFLLDFNFSASTPFGSFAMVFIFVFVIFPDRCSWFSFFFLCVCRVYARLLFNSQPILYAGIIVLNSLHAAVAHTDVATVQQQNWLKEAMQYVTFSIILF